MKLSNILILLIIIQNVLIDNVSNTRNSPEKIHTRLRQIQDDSSSDSIECSDYENEDASPQVCKDKPKSNNKNSCCFFSFVDGANRIKRCIEIKKDYFEILQFINSLESNKINDVNKFDDVSVDCFSNIIKYNFKMFLFLLFTLINI